MLSDLSIPPHFLEDSVERVYRVPYQDRAAQARDWAGAHDLKPAADDHLKIALLAVDVQNTFCIPGFELFVAGRSGRAAVEDNLRLCKFLYRNLGAITQVFATMDTHQAMQIFHAIYLVNEEGKHPEPFTQISADDISTGRWAFNPEIARSLKIDPGSAREHLLYYARTLQEKGKYSLSVWPYHSMLGGIGHALVSAFEEAVFFHTIARYSQADFRIKGRNAATEHYSVLGPEVSTDARGSLLEGKDHDLLEKLWSFDAIVIAGQAKSHCVAWTIEDLLAAAQERDRDLVQKIYLLEDCCSPVVVPNVIDYTVEADSAFERFANAGMHVVRSTTPLLQWPGMDLARKGS